MKKLLIILPFLLFSCSEETGIKGSTDRLEKPITVTVATVKNELELKKIYGELTGIPNAQIPDQYGFAQWNERKDGSDPLSYNCQIYILEPGRKNDQQILTLGHEMAHCIWGSYHQ